MAAASPAKVSAQRPREAGGGWTKQPEEVRRRAILDAARKCFAAKGYAQTSMQDVASAAGLTKGGVYFHFESKEAIQQAVVTEFTDVERFALDAADVLAMPPDQRLREQLQRLADGLKGDGAILTLTEAITRFGAGVDEAKAFFVGIVTQLARTIHAGQQSGVLRAQGDPQLLAELAMATIDGLALHHELDACGIDMCRGPERILDLLAACIIR